MKYPYIVIHNGKWYNAGEEVPESNSPVSSVGYNKDRNQQNEYRRLAKTCHRAGD